MIIIKITTMIIFNINLCYHFRRGCTSNEKIIHRIENNTVHGCAEILILFRVYPTSEISHSTQEVISFPSIHVFFCLLYIYSIKIRDVPDPDTSIRENSAIR